MGGFQDGAGIRRFPRDPGLLLLEPLHRQPGVEGLQQLVLFCRKSFHPRLLPLHLALARPAHVAQFVVQALPQLLDPLRLELNCRAVEALNRLFDGIDLDVSLSTPVACLPTSAEEVVVGTAVAVGQGHDEPGVAAAAEDASFEVVVVRAPAFRGVPSGPQDLLNLVEQLVADERLVPSLVLDAAG